MYKGQRLHTLYNIIHHVKKFALGFSGKLGNLEVLYNVAYNINETQFQLT